MSLVSEGAELAGNRASSVDQGPSIASVGDYVALMKPRVMSLVVFTALVGVMIAPGHLHPVIGFTALLCIAVGAGAAGVLNMWYDADIDAVMRRTSARPIPQGRIAPGEALAFGIVLAAFAVGVLGLLVSWLAAMLLAFTIFFYVAVYTAWLKRWTPQNIVIGGAAGAMPPVLGWAAVTGQVGAEPLLLFLIIFVWTPPHFWSLALYRTEEYARAGVPMLPVTHGKAYTRLQILLYTMLLFGVSLLPFAARMSGWLYLGAAIVLGTIFLGYALRMVRAYSDALAHRTFRYSISYLALLFAALLVDHYL